MNLLVQGGQMVNGSLSGLEYADILIKEDRIVNVGTKIIAPPDAQELDATGHIIIPGLINAHTHSHNSLMKALGDNWTLEDLRNHGTALYTNRTPEDHYLSAAIGAIEMIKTGCTAAYDQFMIPGITEDGVEAIIRAYMDVGLRAVLAPCVSDILFYKALPDFLEVLPLDLRRAVESIKVEPTESLLRSTENAIRRWNGSANGRIRIAVSPVILGECTDQLLSGCSRIAKDYGVSLHTHLAETKVQALGGLHRWGKTIVGHLADIGMLGPHFVGGHGVWITNEDIRQLADTGSMVAHLPASNLKLGSGIAPVSEMLDHGVTVGLGTDGSMSSDNQNMFEAMRFAALVSRVRFPHHPERWVGAQSAWNMATTGSARVLGLENDVEKIEPGYKADLVLLRADSIFLRPLNNAINALVYAETGASVATVIIDGRVVLENGRVLRVNEQQLLHRAQETAGRLREHNTAAWAFAEQLTPYIKMSYQAIIAKPYPINRYAAPVGMNCDSNRKR